MKSVSKKMKMKWMKNNENKKQYLVQWWVHQFVALNSKLKTKSTFWSNIKVWNYYEHKNLSTEDADATTRDPEGPERNFSAKEKKDSTNSEINAKTFKSNRKPWTSVFDQCQNHCCNIIIDIISGPIKLAYLRPELLNAASSCFMFSTFYKYNRAELFRTKFWKLVSHLQGALLWRRISIRIHRGRYFSYEDDRGADWKASISAFDRR